MNLDETMVSTRIGTTLTRSTLIAIHVHPNPFENFNFNRETFFFFGKWTLVVVGPQLWWA
jgi:hypothetical protein